MKYHLLVVCLLLLKCWSNAEADWVDPNELGTGLFLKSFFAGYLDVSDDKKFYYVYHPSENNPTKDPVVVWFGSGPGCSSLYSMIYSKGPFTITPNKTEFRFNQFNWNKEANVLFIEGPAGVGFSIGSGIPSDYQLAQDYVKAIISFFKKFPDLKDQDLYYAGQGYAGVQIPWLANRTLEWNNAIFTPATQKIRLRGLFLGNPCTQPEECYVSGFNLNSYKYLTNHYYYTRLQYEQFVNKCMGFEQPGCAELKKEMDNFFISTGADRRNIYKKCLKQNTGDYPNIPCLDQIGAYQWFNDPQFRKGIHVNISESKKWTICNDDIQKIYFKDPRGSYFLYPSLIEARLRIWVYSGVLDANNPVTGTMKWIEELREHYGIATIKPWTPWFVNDVNAGDVWVLRGLNVLTVRSAGHLVFSDEPELGYYLYDSFLKDRALS